MILTDASDVRDNDSGRFSEQQNLENQGLCLGLMQLTRRKHRFQL